MHDVKYIRENPDAFAANLKRRGIDVGVNEILELDIKRRSSIAHAEEARRQRNQRAEEVKTLFAQGKKDNALELIQKSQSLKNEDLDAPLRNAEAKIKSILENLPNLLLDDVPNGADASSNKTLKIWDDEHKPTNHTPKPGAVGRHYQPPHGNLFTAAANNAAKISGARFTLHRHDPIVYLERALINFMLDTHISKHAYEEVSPPYLVRGNALYGTGQLPKFADDQYKTSQDDLWLIPTAEVPLTNLARDSIVHNLPWRLVAHTPCFRREAGASGQDTAGVIRQHQFHKVELVSVCTPDQSAEELERMTQCAETILQLLNLPYRRVLLCSGDTGFAAQKTYDLEVWMAGENTWREISSCSLCGEFQARRMNARYKPSPNQPPQFVHTLNGSGVAVGRAIAALVERHTDANSVLHAPQPLHKYLADKPHWRQTNGASAPLTESKETSS